MLNFSQSLHPIISAYAVKNFRLKDDLLSLERVYSARASEATIFYCARILEVIINDAHGKLSGESGDAQKLAENVERLRAYNLIPSSSYYWAKGLRLLGNDVRHINRSIHFEEAEIAIFFLSFCLSWFFCCFPLGPMQPTIYQPNASFVPPAQNRLVELAWKLEKRQINPDTLLKIVYANEKSLLAAFPHNPTLPTLLLDMLLAAGEHEAAGRLIEGIESSRFSLNGHFPRFVELKGLYLSRTGKLSAARDLLADDHYQKNRYRVTDEQIGILAGVYKKLWATDGDQKDLKQSHDLYLFGWEQRQVRKQNCYLGINAASTALWLGERENSSRLAREVNRTLEQRRQTIREKTAERYDLDYWDMVTLAEAKVLSGEHPAAGDLYRQAFSQYPQQKQNIEVTRNQLGKLLEALSAPPTVRDLFSL